MGPTSAHGDVVIVAGALAHRSAYGGHAWVFLNYLLGFRRLGFDVLFLDRLEPDMAIDEQTAYANVRDILEPFGLGESFSILCPGRRTLGLQHQAVLDTSRRSFLLLNVMGFLDDEEILGAAPRRAFLDIDPGFSQMWRELGLADVMKGHDAFVTVGANVGHPDCAVPTCGLDWIATRPPVVLNEWPRCKRRGPFSSVGAWRGPFAPVEFGGKTYGLRAHELRRFMALPQMTHSRFELALDIHPGDAKDTELLESSGWVLLDPREVAATPSSYRTYLQRSGAEFAAAKNMYVQAQSGWFSDRSACYLASGKPVLVQDTGLGSLYPTGSGLITFSSIEGAAVGVEAIESEYERHARAARELAEEVFDSDRVLSALVDRLAA